jgi:hypothetical protein
MVVSVLVAVVVSYGALVAIVGSSATKTIGIGYICAIVTLFFILRITEYRHRDR